MSADMYRRILSNLSYRAIVSLTSLTWVKDFSIFFLLCMCTGNGRRHDTTCLTYSLRLPPLSTSSPDPSGGVQLLPGHAVVIGARRAVRRCGFLRRRLREGTGVGARRRAVCRQPVLQTAAPGAQDQVGQQLAPRTLASRSPAFLCKCLFSAR